MKTATISVRIGSVLCTLLLFAALPAYPAQQQSATKETFETAGIKRIFHFYAPDSVASSAAPLVVLLHGSYGSGSALASRWSDLARAEAFIIVAPDARDREAWQIRADGPAFIHALVDAVERLHPIDRRRMYLFGHSGGAVYALTLSMIESQYFAATAVHAGAWRGPREFIAVPYAARKIPVAIFVGDRDEYFALHGVRKTEEVLREAGHPVNLTVIPGHTHDYRKVSDRVNRDAWNWLKVNSLNAAPAP